MCSGEVIKQKGGHGRGPLLHVPSPAGWRPTREKAYTHGNSTLIYPLVNFTVFFFYVATKYLFQFLYSGP